MITKENQTTTFCSLPTIFGSPTECNNLFSSLKEVQKINDLLCYHLVQNHINFRSTTVFKVLQLESNLLGKLHVVFTAFKMLGKIIDGSDLDKAFEEALIYGSNTVEQMKDGHHLYRCFEGHQMLCLSLSKK